MGVEYVSGGNFNDTRVGIFNSDDIEFSGSNYVGSSCYHQCSTEFTTSPLTHIGGAWNTIPEAYYTPGSAGIFRHMNIYGLNYSFEEHSSAALSYHPVLSATTEALFGASWTNLTNILSGTAPGIFVDYNYYSLQELNPFDVDS